MSTEYMHNRPRKYYSKELKNKVVSHIVNGECLIEEVMKNYQIESRETIIRWLSAYVKKRKDIF